MNKQKAKEIAARINSLNDDEVDALAQDALSYALDRGTVTEDIATRRRKTEKTNAKDKAKAKKEA